FLPAFPGPDGRVAPTGLEPLLSEFGVQVTPDRRLVGVPRQHAIGGGRALPSDTAFCVPFRDLRLKLVETFAIGPVLRRNCRPVRTSPGAAGGFQTHQVLGTPPRSVYWLEPDWKTRPETVIEQLRNDKEGNIAAEKQFTNQSVPVAVAVTESGGDPKKG